MREVIDRFVVTNGRSENLTVGAYLQRWLTSQHNLTDATRARYEGIVRLHLIPLLGGIRLVDLDPDHIDGLLDTLGDPNYVAKVEPGTAGRQRPA
jgi:hypothetical protein